MSAEDRVSVSERHSKTGDGADPRVKHLADDTDGAMREAMAREAKRPAWIPDEMAAKCGACHADFKLMRRRHHCR